MSNFSQKLEDATNEELMHWINEFDFRVVPLASDELTRQMENKGNLDRWEVSLFKKKSGSDQSFTRRVLVGIQRGWSGSVGVSNAS